MIDKQRLEEKCSTWNIALTGTQLDQLDAFAQILVDYNQKVNLTAITDPEGIEDKHFLDSLLFASQPEVAGRMVDVGAGAGFPGIVTKIFKPELELTLMEPTGKRVDFLKYACAQLGLTGGFHFPGRLPGGHGAGPHRPGHPPENDHHRPAAGGQQPPAPQHRRRCTSQSGGTVLNTEYLNDRKTGAENAPVFSVFPGKSPYLQYHFC